MVQPDASAFHHDVNVVTCSFFHRFADAVIHCFGFLRIDFAGLVLDVNYRACAVQLVVTFVREVTADFAEEIVQ